MDSRFWQRKRTFSWKNIGQEPCPAFSPIVFMWDNDGHTPGPWIPGETVFDDGRLALPAFMGGMAETGYANALYAINGPFDVQPDSYGECSTDYPLPILFDPESFPIPISDAFGNPTGQFEPGTWQEYTDAYPGDIEGPPLLGFVADDGVLEGWQPATFMADFILWSVVFWQPKTDGSRSDDLAIVVPATAVGNIPYGGSTSVFTGSNPSAATTVQATANTPITLNTALTVAQSGLYRLALAATVEIDYPGVAATLKVQVTFGPGWIGKSGTNQAGAFNPPPVPGQTNTILTGGRQVPRIQIVNQNTDSLSVTVSGTAYPVTGDTDNFLATYNTYGYEPLAMDGYFYLMAGDELTVQVVTSANQDNGSPVTINVNGGLSYLKLTNNPIGSFPILY